MPISKWFGLFGALVVVCAAGPAHSAACPGDCSGTKMVQINDLITCVSIALGLAQVSACSACDVNGDQLVEINEVIAAVNAAVEGCPGASTPTPIEPSVTPTATPTPAASVSMWTVGPYHVASSTCAGVLNTGVVSGLQALGSHVTVSESGGNARIDFGGGKVFDGTVDPDGTVHVQTAAHGAMGPCDYELDDDAMVNLSTSPTTATYDNTVKLSGLCQGLADCSLKITSQWTRL